MTANEVDDLLRAIHDKYSRVLAKAALTPNHDAWDAFIAILKRKRKRELGLEDTDGQK